MFDVVIIGAGPVGLASGIEAKRRGLKYCILEKGILVNSIVNFPTYMTFFTTADLLEIGNHPFPVTDIKPNRQQTLDYYRRVTELEDLFVKQYHEVNEIEGQKGRFTIRGRKTRKGSSEDFQIKSKYIIVATGYYDNPVGLGGIPGEDMKHVSHYYTDPHKFYDHDVVVVGAGNSGAEASLELYRHGANVTLVHKHTEVAQTLKYWVEPDIKNRLKEGTIKGVMPAKTKRIKRDGIVVDTPKEKDKFIPADQIFVLTGFTPNVRLLEKWGLELTGDLSVDLDDKFQSNRRGIYVVGSAGSGEKTNSVFIENGREHAKLAVNDIHNALIN